MYIESTDGNTVRAFVLIGSNIRPKEHMKAAVRQLRNRTSVRGVSTVYRTKPVGLTDQPDFLNAAVELVTDRSPEELRSILKTIERELGRDRSGPKDGPRRIDLDLALYDRRSIHTDHLDVPDPAIRKHAHAAVPLAELAPDLILPEEGRSLSRIAEDVANAETPIPQPDLLLSG